MDFSPSVYEHAAFLIGRTPWEVSRDADLLYEAHAEAYRRYQHSPIVVGIDIYNLEAEAYGGVIEKPHGVGIPAVARPILGSAGELCGLRPFDPQSAGRIPMVLEVARRLAAEFSDADVRVPLSGPFSIAASLVGFESLLCDVLTQPDEAAAGLMRLVDGQVDFCHAINQAGVDVAFFESAAAPPLLSPEMFRRVELPALRSTIDCAASVMGHPIPCIIGGDTTPILPRILETGTKYVICPIETDQRAFMREIWDRTDVRVRVNTSSEVMVRGTREAIGAEVDRIVELTAGRANVCLGTGALPYETPPENVLFVKACCEGL
ncbi:MAG TPA: uroporphyrinogen decarboxylase family protein [Thermoguttaceae bacterium]|nr:uroporphyrinogen decarboxylase family protein [Thermoguttaceae bacterium]